MIRKGGYNDIETIMTLCKACTDYMISNNIFQWNEHYPNAKTFENDVFRNELYVLEIKDELIGTIVIYSSLFSIGSFVYGNILNAIILLVVAVLGTFFLFKSFGKLRAN